MTSRRVRTVLSLVLCSVAIAAAGCRGVRLRGTKGPSAAPGAVAAAEKAAKPVAKPVAAPAQRFPAVAATPRRVGDFDAQDVPLEQALAEARRQNRPCAILFVTPWCGWCRRLERDTLPDAAVRAELANWYVVRYDADKPAGRSAAARYGVQGFPTVTLLDSAGHDAGVAAGFSEPAPFASKLRAARH
jgi:thiol:disulfide interchange protein